MKPAIVAASQYGDRSAPPLLFIRALPAEVGNPRGLDRLLERLIVRGPARTHRVLAVGRPARLPQRFEMSEIAQVYADLLRRRLAGPVALMGLSTGSSVALQLAADHPELVSSLVVAAGAARLAPRGRAIQARYADSLAAGHPRAAAEMAGATVNVGLLDPLVRVAGRLLPPPGHPDSLVALIEAEDRFDVLDRLHRITAPALVVSGGRDVFYPPELGRETAERMPRARQIVYPARSHSGVPLDPRFAGDVASFLRQVE